MDKEPLTLDHQDLLEERFQRLGLELSEYTFANIYLFRDVHQYELIRSKDVYIKGKTRDGFTYLMLTSPIEHINFDEVIECLHSGCDFIFPVPEAWLSHFDPKLFQFSFLEQDSDYLYTVSKMSTYAGRHLSGRRNLVTQFKDLFPQHSDLPLDVSRTQDALLILEEWHKHAKEEPFTDYSACREALHLIDKLHLNGHISYVDDKPAAFLIGEPLNVHTYVIHFAKALIEYKGIYQYLYQAFAKTIENKFQCINLEQDLGSIELKHAKRSYQPDKYAIKYRVKEKNYGKQ